LRTGTTESDRRICCQCAKPNAGMEIPARSLVGNPAKIVKTFEREQVSDAPYAFGPRR